MSDNSNLGKIIVVTSGKGGVGKTSSSAAIAAELARLGHKTVAVDFDIGLRNLDLAMGCDRRVVFDFINVVQQEASLAQALIRDKRLDNLYTLAASQTRDKDALTETGVLTTLNELRRRFEYIICDSPAGIEHGAIMALRFADRAIIVTNPEMSSLRDSDRIIGVLQNNNLLAQQQELPIHVLITRFDPKRVQDGEMLSITDIEDILSLPLLGIIPESKAILVAARRGVPVTLDSEPSHAQDAYRRAVQRLLGKAVPFPHQLGFFRRMWNNLSRLSQAI